MAVRGPRNTITISNKLIIDMSSEISILSPSETPLLTLLTRKGKKETKTPKFEWLEDDLGEVWNAINHPGGYTPTDTDLVVDDASIFNDNDIVQVPRTGELMRVTVVNTTSNTITVIRGWGSVPADYLNDDEPLQIIGGASMEGSYGRKAISTVATVNYNLTQIFRTPINITGTARSSATWDGGDLAFMRYKKGIEHALEIERAFLFGERKEDLSESHPRRTTGGLNSTISTNRLNAMGSLDESTFNSFLAQLFRYGSQTKYMFCSGSLISRIAGWAHGLLQMRPTDTTAGIAITEYISAHGRLLLIPHRMLTGAIFGSYGIIVDLEELAYRYLTDRDTKLYTNIQPPDYDGEIDEYLTECGLEIRNEAKHGIIYNI